MRTRGWNITKIVGVKVYRPVGTPCGCGSLPAIEIVYVNQEYTLDTMYMAQHLDMDTQVAFDTYIIKREPPDQLY